MSQQDKPILIQTVFKRIWVFVIGTVLAVVLLLAWPFLWNNGSVRYADINEHFKYGSIGGEKANGIPYWVWKVLPVVFADKLPGKGYTSLGFIQEPGKDLPIGFSQSKIGFERVGQNCATCHAGSVRETPNSQPQIITTMPSNTVNLGAYIRFLSDIAIDERFNAREMMPHIEAMGAKLNPLEKLVYRYFVIPQTRDALILQRSKFAFMDSQSDYGPGRVDTFSSYKTRQFNFPIKKLSKDELNGIADFPSIWEQRQRQGMQLHWDGNNNSVDERNNSAALALVTPTTINFDAIHRVKDWLLDLPAPSYPYPINENLAAVGKPIFENTCASCHVFGGSQVGKVVPIKEIGTDPGRLDSYTYETLSNQNTLFTDISYQGVNQRFNHFRKTNGYASMPLDGIWLRSPYLHNGSVPSLRDLLEAPEKRPQEFYRGYDVFDQKNVGFVSNVAAEGDHDFFKFDTKLPGNSNSGHLYGTDLSSEEKEALVEYMKKL
ncbi:cytochrome c [Aetokthonos hydrillicola Thurmond2011]|jgi:mono/diheme cytochrome c family protein|uniref:Cytochrome c n=1 Tax=Aetokthonos hydrillicola Thurmond2011 TaxID=2712845 RepID=A0AAP5I304_9CYAN|nr:cytochrome c [Aetokthonos hydrillicola]MBO3457477.1 cytochrome c [Aetokthonos hydrillicola CCALA 1050]MBW4586001.1 cytochrome c [Aetokthonos hydrillicola CCALA 1050]MDR9893770.1 cytochrome c [Aetokthonos hydrillicola Thurmond2011]